MPTTTIRKSVPLAPAQLDLLERLRQHGSDERTTIEQAIGVIPETASEAYLLHALIAYAEKQLRDQILDAQYARRAATLDDEDRQWAELVRSRRRDRDQRHEE
jgi:hypothetical protein